MSDDRLRIGDAEREQAARALGEHFAQGRIDNSEHDERLSAIWGAKTAADIRPVFDDLPGPRPTFLAPPQRAPRPFGFPGPPLVPQTPVPYQQQLPLAPQPPSVRPMTGQWWFPLLLVLAAVAAIALLKGPGVIIALLVLWMIVSRKRSPRARKQYPGPYPTHGQRRQGWH